MRPILAFLMVLALFLVGCGGGGGGGSNTVSNATFRIEWPARTRALDSGLSSALSASVVFANAASDGTNVTVDVNRDGANLAAHTETYAVPGRVRKSVSQATATFYAEANQGGAVVGTATATIDRNGTSLDLTTFSLTGTIKTVSVVVPSALGATSPATTLQATARDANGAAVAVTPGSFAWSLVGTTTAFALAADGTITPSAPGTGQVRVTIDGVTSETATITISGAVTTVLPVAANDLKYDANAGRLWALVGNDGTARANSLVPIDPATGEIGTAIPISVEGGHLALTDDGQYAFVTVQADATVRRVNLSTGAIDVYPVNEGRDYVDIRAVPGTTNSYAVAIDPTGGVNASVWDGPVRRSGTGAVGGALWFASPTLIYGDGGSSLFTDVVDPTSITWTDQTPLDVSGFAFSPADGYLYTNQGRVVDPVAKNVVAQLSTADFLVDRGPAIGVGDDRIYYVTWDSGTDKRIVTFDRTTRTELELARTGVTQGGALHLTAAGAHRVAFHLFGIGVTKSVVLVRGLP